MGFWGQRAGGKSPGRGHPLHSTTQTACFWIRFGMRILTAKLRPQEAPEPASAKCHQLIEGSSPAINSHTS